MEVLCVCGQWRSKDSFQWEFHVDLNRNASFISIEEDLQFEDLMKIVSEDFKEELIGLSYGMSLDIKSIVNADSPSCNNQDSYTFASPVSTVQREIQVHLDTDPASCNMQTSDTFASHISLNATPVFRSTVQREKQTVQDTLPNQELILPEHLDFAVVVQSHKTNPGSLTYQQVDAAGKFKYAFVAFGPSIRGFSLMRKVIAVDVVDAENGASWKWFFRGLSQKIPDASDLVFKLVSRLGAAMLLNVYQVDRSELEVKDETMKFVVDLEKRHCTCNVFDIDKIPCIHAIAAAKHIKRDENRFVDASHLTETWAKAYAESIHPGGELSTSTYPENIDELSCPPPATKKKSGRPPTKRKRSVGEFGVPGSKSQSHKCSRCGTGGHNKSTCERPIG
ncbi:BnaC08g47100D [Brassica napus]|uniref:BnaC08g47100D protein n=1 Tax=Brassica napus TaxID=3708 RepID=A0A078IQ31_BRANA|nr:BnaC08g47100D [Brassica napus]